MLKLVVFNLLLILVVAALLIIVKRTVKSEWAQNITLLIAAITTILFHYSTFIFYLITGGPAIEYLNECANLILPIYPCNVVMWCCLILPLLKNKQTGLSKLLIDYVFWFGIFSTLVGMFANVDFIMNPTLLDYHNVKSIAAHATLLFNVLLLAIYGKVRLDFFRNMKNMLLSVLGMYAIGLYCNLLFAALVSEERAYDVNSMFIIHSPFPGLEFLRYHVIAVIGLFLYFILFTVCDVIKNKKGERWYDKALALLQKNTQSK